MHEVKLDAYMVEQLLFNFLQKESEVGEQAQETHDQRNQQTNLISPPAFRQWSSSSAAHTSRRAASASHPPQAASGLSGKMTTWYHLMYSSSTRMPSLCHEQERRCLADELGYLVKL